MISPDRTYAVVVGIERYEAGSMWDLDGAADSALRIIGWLRGCEVPAANITVLLSPLDSNRSKVEQRLAELGLPPEPLPATVEKIRHVITEQLPGKDGDPLGALLERPRGAGPATGASAFLRQRGGQR